MRRTGSIGCDVPSYFQSLKHLLRYRARPSFALERLSVIRGADGRIRYAMPRHKAANWVGPGRGRKSTRTCAHGLVELSPCEFLDRLADLIPQPRKHRHRYHGVFASNHLLRPSVTALAIPPQRRLPAGVGFLRTGGSQADDGQDGFARVNPAPHTPRPTARTAANLASSRAAHRLGRTRPGP